ncbi:MAG TPA: fibronectin type III domain-containing protein, partial [Thermoplasmata archaeon]|nr:fibronectin type III domain-containing protein [Thermoplasmata archaeon]
GPFLGTLPAGGSVTGAGLSMDPSSGILLDALAATGQRSYFAEVLPPSPPTNVSVESANSSLTVRWDASSVPFPAPVLGYVVTASFGGSGSLPGSTVYSNVTVSPATVTGLVNGRIYAVQVAAVDAAGPGPASPATTATPVGLPYPPSTPVEEASSTSTLTVGWSAPNLTGGLPITNYTVRWAPASGGAWSTATTSATTWTLRGLAPASSYRIEVAATNAVGTGNPSAVASVTTSPSPGATILGVPSWVVALAGAAVGGLAVAGIVRGYRGRQRAGSRRPPSRAERPAEGAEPPSSDDRAQT